MTKGKVCERCLGRGREWHCILQNCEGEIFKSINYAARNAFARISGMIRQNVTVFVVQSEFQKQRFIAGGVRPDQISVLPGVASADPLDATGDVGGTIVFVGRLSEEKGIREFVAAAAKLPNLRFEIAGDARAMADLVAEAPSNVTFLGFVAGRKLDEVFGRARILVCPSKWFEGFPNVVVQAMAHRKPVIASRIGALPEIVDDGVTGVLVEPGDVSDLAAKIEMLWRHPEMCQTMGTAGLQKVRTKYSKEAFRERLFGIYESAIRMNSAAIGNRQES